MTANVGVAAAVVHEASYPAARIGMPSPPNDKHVSHGDMGAGGHRPP